ncbi:MAG: hypothetical protein Mars2KO_05200 [Maribacter sp.]
MILDGLNYLRDELSFGLGLPANEVIIENLRVLHQNDNANGLYISLFNIEQENVLKNTPHHTQINNQLRYKEPPVYLNLFVFFAFEFSNYGTSLQRMSDTIEYFQSKSWFSSENERAANPFPTIMNKMVLELFSLNFEQMNHIWGVLGGDHFPSVMYKLRMIKLQRDIDIAGPEITTISINSSVSN